MVYEYIEQIQRGVNKVQGHPSDLYPELFTPHIVHALIDENQGKSIVLLVEATIVVSFLICNTW